MDNYEIVLEENKRRNEKYVKEFDEWLKEKGLVNKTIKKHISNIAFYLNEYLNYYEITNMEEGVFDTYLFLSDWLIRKCLWSSKTSIKENASSIKKLSMYE